MHGEVVPVLEAVAQVLKEKVEVLTKRFLIKLTHLKKLLMLGLQ
jgi:hypothetical protein